MRSTPFVMLAVLAVASSALAGEGAVSIGEVSSQVTRAGVDYAPILRAASELEISSLALAHVAPGKHAIVSVALVRLDTLPAQRATHSHCKITATLRDARGGALIAILDGEAQASSSEPAPEVERSAVQGALHGALAHIPDALTR